MDVGYLSWRNLCWVQGRNKNVGKSATAGSVSGYKPRVRILEAGKESTEVFGEMKDQLKKAGTPLPINDVWIAAHTMETGSVLVSYE